MFKTAALGAGALLVVGATLWGLIDVIYRPYLYLPTRVQPYGASTFLALPRYSSGGYSLAKESDGVLRPWPDRLAHATGVIGNAVDIRLDCRGSLWVLDSGYVDTLRKPVKLNEPRILAFDADSGKIGKVIPLKGLIKGRAQYLAVDETNKGARSLYVSDGPARSIAVWDLMTDGGHRVVLPERIVAHPVQSKVLYMALVGDKLYFTYFGSFDLYCMKKDGLKSGGRVVRAGRKDPRMIMLGVEGNRIIFRLAGTNEVLSWDTRTPLMQGNLELVDRGNGGLNQMAVVPNFGKLWVLDGDVRGFLDGKQSVHHFRPARTNRTLEPTNHVFPEIKTV
ncbi:Major royal jelly protein [Nesidiocoris tenuis]|uniref:Major royal jelly protein n=1 Tax=Nesidiocoris tenuis TaxID=355587 RepID=A0ABN7B803_9HEMI|nr:Major royal jelly protein [Nesidiocoris tenuis]